MGGALRGYEAVDLRKAERVRKRDGRELERNSDARNEHVHVLMVVALKGGALTEKPSHEQIACLGMVQDGSQVWPVKKELYQVYVRDLPHCATPTVSRYLDGVVPRPLRPARKAQSGRKTKCLPNRASILPGTL